MAIDVAIQGKGDIDAFSNTLVSAAIATSHSTDDDAQKGPSKKRRRQHKLPVFLRGQEPDHLLTATSNRRDFTIAQVALLAGLRVSEIVNLRVEDVDFDEATLMVIEGKGGKDRLVPMPTRLAMALRTWIGSNTAGYVFPAKRSSHGSTGHLSQRSVQRIVKDAAARAGIARTVTPHKLRHTYATKALKAGLNLREVQQMLGHASVATTEIYTHVVVDEGVRGALERL